MKNVYSITEDEVICLDKIVRAKKESCFYDALGKPLETNFYLKIIFIGNYYAEYGFQKKANRDSAYDSLVEALKERDWREDEE